MDVYDFEFHYNLIYWKYKQTYNYKGKWITLKQKQTGTGTVACDLYM